MCWKANFVRSLSKLKGSLWKLSIRFTIGYSAVLPLSSCHWKHRKPQNSRLTVVQPQSAICHLTFLNPYPPSAIRHQPFPHSSVLLLSYCHWKHRNTQNSRLTVVQPKSAIWDLTFLNPYPPSAISDQPFPHSSVLLLSSCHWRHRKPQNSRLTVVQPKSAICHLPFLNPYPPSAIRHQPFPHSS